MTYEIACVGTARGWQYRVTLWFGRVAYVGNRTYDRHGDALKAARATGAEPKEGA
jgi:hypothetical protein